MKNLLENYNLLFAMTALTAVAILIKCICAIRYQILLHDSEQITTTKNKWLRSMITKYEACYKLKMPVYHTEAFLQSYIQHYRILGCPATTLENSDLFSGLLVTGCTLFSMMCGIYYELPTRWILIHSMTLVLFLIFLCFSEILFQVRHKRKLLQLQLINHFENHLRPKLENQYLHPEELATYQQEYFDDKPKKDTTDSVTEESQNEVSDVALSPDMQELIASLQREDKLTEEINETKEKLSAAATQEKYRLVEEIIKEYM